MINRNRSKNLRGLKSGSKVLREYALRSVRMNGSGLPHRTSSSNYAKVIRYIVTSEDDEITRMVEASRNLKSRSNR